MTSSFDADELRRLNQTPAERLVDWAEEKFKQCDYGASKGRSVGFSLMSENEDMLFAFIRRLDQEELREIRQKLRILEGQCSLLEHALEMVEPGYETESQSQERLAVKKRLHAEQRMGEIEA